MATDPLNDLRLKLHAHGNTIMRLDDELTAAKRELAEMKKDPHERRRLPDERKGQTFHLKMTTPAGPYDLYVMTGEFDDGRPGEVFVRAAKMGTMVAGFLDAWAIGVSMLLQRGEAIEKICEKYRRQSFEPAGHVVCGDLRFGATSLVDAVVGVLEGAYVSRKEARDEEGNRG